MLKAKENELRVTRYEPDYLDIVFCNLFEICSFEICSFYTYLSSSLLPLIWLSAVVCFFTAPFEFSSFVTLCHEILILSFL